MIVPTLFAQGHLGYALGGAHFGYRNATIKITTEVFKNGGKLNCVVVDADMQQYDKYTFPPQWARDNIAEYNAADQLEHKYHYPPFFHEEKWHDTFKYNK